MLAKKRSETEGIPNLAEMLKLMACYKAVWPETHTLDLLKYGGFKIKGLQGTYEHFPAHHGHALAWNETLKVGLCTCGWAGEEGWEEKMTQIQYDMHKRRSVASG